MCYIRWWCHPRRARVCVEGNAWSQHNTAGYLPHETGVGKMVGQPLSLLLEVAGTFIYRSEHSALHCWSTSSQAFNEFTKTRRDKRLPNDRNGKELSRVYKCLHPGALCNAHHTIDIYASSHCSIYLESSNLHKLRTLCSFLQCTGLAKRKVVALVSSISKNCLPIGIFRPAPTLASCFPST